MEELLKQYQDIKREIDHLKYRIDSIYSRALYPKNKIITDMPMSASFDNRGLETVFEEIEELTEVYKTKIAELTALCQKIEDKIADADLESIERLVVRSRYLDGKQWSEISTELGYSTAQLHRINKRALAKFAKDDAP